MRKKVCTRNVGVLLSEEIYQKIIAITDQQEVPISTFIRNLVEEFIDEQEKRSKFNDAISDLNKGGSN
jgi:predicted DNA-binding protein